MVLPFKAMHTACVYVQPEHHCRLHGLHYHSMWCAVLCWVCDCVQEKQGDEQMTPTDHRNAAEIIDCITHHLLYSSTRTIRRANRKKTNSIHIWTRVVTCVTRYNDKVLIYQPLGNIYPWLCALWNWLAALNSHIFIHILAHG